MLMFDMRHDVVSAVGKKLVDLKPAELKRAFRQLEIEACEKLEKEGIERANRQLSFSLDMRYVGQGHTVSVPFDANAEEDLMAQLISESFQKVYMEVYGYSMELSAEVVNVRIKAIGEIPKPRLRQLKQAAADMEGSEAALKGLRRAVDIIDGEVRECRVFDRPALLAGSRIDGPAIIEESTTVTPIGFRQICIVDLYGNLVISRR